MSERRLTGITGLHHQTKQPCEVRDGDNVWGKQPNYYASYGRYDARNGSGSVFWNELANDGAGEWRAVEGQFADFYTARDHPESLGYPLAKFTDLIVYPRSETYMAKVDSLVDALTKADITQSGWDSKIIDKVDDNFARGYLFAKSSELRFSEKLDGEDFRKALIAQCEIQTHIWERNR